MLTAKAIRAAVLPPFMGFLHLMTGRQRLPLAGANLPADSSSFPPIVLPAGRESSGAALLFPVRRLQATEPPTGSQGWPRPFSLQASYTREAQLPLPVFRHGADQVSMPHSHVTSNHDVAAQRSPTLSHSSNPAQVLDLFADIPLLPLLLSRGNSSRIANPNIC